MPVTILTYNFESLFAELRGEIDKNLKPQSAALTGWSIRMEVKVKRQETIVKNVIGYLEGNGPLADETIVVGAHYDHLGYGGPGSLGGGAAKGKIHHGADDNGSGTTSVIELARRFGAMKQREGRRMVFMTFHGTHRSGTAHPHDAAPSMAVPLIVLALGSAVAGFRGRAVRTTSKPATSQP